MDAKTCGFDRAPASPEASADNRSDRPIDRLFRRMVEQGASDLHLCVSAPPLLRKDGDLVPIEGEPALDAKAVEALIRPILPERNAREFDDEHDTDFAYEVPGCGRFRCNVYLDRKGWGGAFRLIPEKIPTPDEIGLPAAALRLCDLPKGLVLVTGPTGSGKSTTLATMIDHINRNRRLHIITIEDPIEFTHANKKALVNQREVGRHTMSFAKALRAALREDPDVVLVGEMRDLETTRIAIETAETGHLVFATLHTNTAATTVDRIINQFPPEEQEQIRMMLSNSLRGVIAQTLVRRQGGGRCAAREIMLVNTAIATNIREGKTHQIPTSMQMSRGAGNMLLNESLQELVRKRLVPPQEAYAKSLDKEDMARKLRELGFKPAPSATQRLTVPEAAGRS